MRFAFLLGISCLAVAFVARADAPAEPIRLTMGWHVTIDTQGHPTDLEAIPNPRTDRVPQIHEALEREIRTWTFNPGLVNGKPAITQTALILAISVLPQSATNASIRVDHADTGGWYAKVTPPKYPPSAVSAHKVGLVVLKVDYDESGKVTAAVPAPGTPDVAASLTNASVATVRKWTFAPEVVGGHAMAGAAYVPFCYSLSNMPGSLRNPPCDWTPPGRSTSIGDGDALAINPVATLATDVAGRML